MQIPSSPSERSHPLTQLSCCQLLSCHCSNAHFSSESDGSQDNNLWRNRMPRCHNVCFPSWLFYFFTLTGTSNYFRGKREDRKSKDLVQNAALPSSSWGELVSCEIISTKWMASGMHSPDNGQGQKGGGEHTGGWRPAVSKGLTPAVLRLLAASPEPTQSAVGQGGNSHWVPIKTDQVTHVDIPIS